jgi:hypothetical protein
MQEYQRTMQEFIYLQSDLILLLHLEYLENGLRDEDDEERLWLDLMMELEYLVDRLLVESIDLILLEAEDMLLDRVEDMMEIEEETVDLWLMKGGYVSVGQGVGK